MSAMQTMQNGAVYCGPPYLFAFDAVVDIQHLLQSLHNASNNKTFIIIDSRSPSRYGLTSQGALGAAKL